LCLKSKGHQYVLFGSLIEYPFLLRKAYHRIEFFQ
jgi:hypothetical protein